MGQLACIRRLGLAPEPSSAAQERLSVVQDVVLRCVRCGLCSLQCVVMSKSPTYDVWMSFHEQVLVLIPTPQTLSNNTCLAEPSNDRKPQLPRKFKEVKDKPVASCRRGRADV